MFDTTIIALILLCVLFFVYFTLEWLNLPLTLRFSQMQVYDSLVAHQSCFIMPAASVCVSSVLGVFNTIHFTFPISMQFKSTLHLMQFKWISVRHNSIQ